MKLVMMMLEDAGSSWLKLKRYLSEVVINQVCRQRVIVIGLTGYITASLCNSLLLRVHLRGGMPLPSLEELLSP